MGGRGALSSLPKTDGGGGAGSGGQWSNGLGFQNYDSLKDALGKKGRKRSIADAALNSNPHHDATYTYKEFTENCQRCVVAYEARRRGYDVTAQPTYKGDKLPKVAYVNPNTGAKYSYWMGAFKQAKSERIGGRTAKQTQKNIENKMKSYGDGSRAILRVSWKGGGGHVFNVEQKNGKTYYIDAQVGKRYTSKVFQNIRTEKTQLVRTDNLKFSDRAKNFVTKDKW